MFKFGCSLCNKTWQIGEARTCTCKYEDDDDIQDYKKPWVGLDQKDFEDYCKTLHPLWNAGISRAEAEGFFFAAGDKLKEKNT